MAHQTRRLGKDERTTYRGAKLERVKRKGSAVLLAHPPAANLSPNEEGAGTSELAGSSLTAD